MHPPPADPWGSPIDPVSPPPAYNRASAPVPPAVPPRAFREPTRELPVVQGRPAQPDRTLSWQRTKNTTRRRLSDGWGFTAAGLFAAFIGWGLWAAAGRGTGQNPFPGLLFMLVVAAIVFCVARYFGYVVLEKTLRRHRPHARWTHLATGLFLTIAGVAYLMSTHLVIDSDDWMRTGIDWVRSQIQRG